MVVCFRIMRKQTNLLESFILQLFDYYTGSDSECGVGQMEMPYSAKIPAKLPRPGKKDQSGRRSGNLGTDSWTEASTGTDAIIKGYPYVR